MSTKFAEMKHICKKFNHIVALDKVSIEINEGDVTALVGDNGSGKSTLIKLLTGNISPDEGEIVIAEQSYDHLTPKKVIDLGIRTVYQDLSLDNYKNCAENIFLGEELTKGPFLSRKRMLSEAQELLDNLHIQIPDLTETVGNLSGGQRQGIAIARALRKRARLLVLDEPTAAMGASETESIFRLLQQVKQQQITMLLVSHNLFQVFDIADELYVMKAGRRVANLHAKDTTPHEVYDTIKAGG